jgi:PAS domain S-box-containing protein
VAAVAAGWNVLVGLLVLAGWAFDLAPVKSVLPGQVTMKANTALGFLLAGAALALLLPEAEGRPRWRSLAGHAAAALVAALGLLTLSQYLFGWDLGIDQLLVAERLGAVATSAPGRMAPNTALNFLLVGTSLLLLDLRSRRGAAPAQTLALLPLAIGFTAFTGFLYGVIAVTGFTGRFTLMAVHTAFSFVVASAGIVAARPTHGWMRLATSDATGGFLMRTLIPGIALLLSLLAWLRIFGERQGWYPSDLGATLFNMLRIALIAGVVYAMARLMAHLERARDAAQEALRRLNAELEQKVAERTEEIQAAHDALREERDFISSILDIIGALVVVLDRQGRIVRFNHECETTTGWAAADVLGKPFWEPFLPPGEGKEAQTLVARLAAGNFPQRQESLWRTKAGKWRLIAWIHTGVRGADGAVTHLISTGIDISDWRAAEDEIRSLNAGLERRVAERTAQLEAARERLERSNRELEQFAYVASHDLQEPLRKLSAFGDLLTTELGGKLAGDAQDYLARMLAAVARMQALISDLLSLSRVTTRAKPFTPTDLNQTLRDVLSDLEPRLQPTGGRVEADTLPTLDADPIQMHQLLQNLIGNAVKFHKPEQPPVVTLRLQPEPPAGHCQILVADNGIGFDPKYAERIFGIFQRLHGRDAYEGTGIGLAVCRKIVERHHGTVTATGQPGAGAQFLVTLPLRQEPTTDTEGEETTHGHDENPPHPPADG